MMVAIEEVITHSRPPGATEVETDRYRRHTTLHLQSEVTNVPL